MWRELGNSEVEHLRDLLVLVRRANEKNIIWLEITVDDPAVMSALQRSANLADNFCGLIEGQAPYASDSLVQSLADEKLHDHVRVAIIGHTMVKDLNCVSALDSSGGLGFVNKTSLSFLAGRVVGIDELDRHSAAQARVSALPDRTHAAATDHGHDLVLARDETADRRTLRNIVHAKEPQKLYIRRVSDAQLTTIVWLE
jgi:hypothetical protein